MEHTLKGEYMLRQHITLSREEAGYPEVNDFPEHLKYHRASFLKKYVINPVTHRLAWAGVFFLSLGSVIPMSGKLVLNILDGFIHPRSFLEAGRNLAALLLIPVGGGLLSLLSIISPDYIGGSVVKALMMPISLLFTSMKGTPQDKHSILKEIGPRPTPPEHLVYVRDPSITFNGPLRMFLLADNRSYPPVHGKDGIVIDSADIPDNSSPIPPGRYRVVFGPGASLYQLEYDQIVNSNKKIHCNTRAFNYPGVTKDDHVESVNDLVDAGIAEVYDVAKKMRWTNAELEKNLHLYGYCLGSAIALQVALYFKQRHNVNLVTFADRPPKSFADLAARLLAEISGMPEWYMRWMAKASLYGGGEYNIDALAAVKKLDSEKVYCVNLANPKETEKRPSLLQRARRFLGIGKPPASADSIIRDGATLADGLAEEHITCGTRQIYDALGVKEPDRLYSHDTDVNGHFKPLEQLSKDKNPAAARPPGMSGHDYYARIITAAYEQQEAAPVVNAKRL